MRLEWPSFRVTWTASVQQQIDRSASQFVFWWQWLFSMKEDLERTDSLSRGPRTYGLILSPEAQDVRIDSLPRDPGRTDSLPRAQDVRIPSPSTGDVTRQEERWVILTFPLLYHFHPIFYFYKTGRMGCLSSPPIYLFRFFGYTFLKKFRHILVIVI